MMFMKRLHDELRLLRKRRKEIVKHGTQQLARQDDLIANLLRRMGIEEEKIIKESKNHRHSKRPIQFKGMDKRTALEVYIRERAEFGENDYISFVDVVQHLIDNGAFLGEEGREDRNLKILARERPMIYDLSLDGESVRLATSAYITPLTRGDREKAQRISEENNRNRK